MRKWSRRLLVNLTVALACLSAAWAQKFEILHSFGNGTDGGGVWDVPAFDSQGNLYGTTSGGGLYAYGTVWELSPTLQGPWTETVLHSFMQNDPDGNQPISHVTVDSAGDVFGTTRDAGEYNLGTAFELSPGAGSWSFAVLHQFGALGDVGGDEAGFTFDSLGNLYGAAEGGATEAGAVYELSPGSGTWTESILYSFGGTGGYEMGGGVIFDADGDLYGITDKGGSLTCGSGEGCGTAYKLVPGANGWTERVLYRFHSGPDSGYPLGPLVFDTKGNLYGTGGVGGEYEAGTVYELSPTGGGGLWKETILYNFAVGPNGYFPVGGVAMDAKGNLYGATGYGGDSVCDCGVVFKLTRAGHGSWSYSVLHTFKGHDGVEPTSGVILDSAGNIYGAATIGGPYGGGVVYEIIP